MPETALVLRSVDRDMQAYGGFTWPKRGKVEASDWSPEPVSGKGLHGLLWGQGDQALMANPEDDQAVFLVCAVEETKLVDLGGKVKFRAADVIFSGRFAEAWDVLWQRRTDIFPPLRYYHRDLPSDLASIGGDLDLRGYDYPLPNGFSSVGGTLFLRGYNHMLPASLASVGGLDLSTCDHTLPDGLAGVDSSPYNHALPAGLSSIGGDLDLRGYAYALPDDLASVGGSLHLRDYAFPLPDALASVGGSLYLETYNYALPDALASVGSSLYLADYDHPLPDSLSSVGGSLYLWGYSHAVPAGLSVVGGNLYAES